MPLPRHLLPPPVATTVVAAWPAPVRQRERRRWAALPPPALLSINHHQHPSTAPSSDAVMVAPQLTVSPALLTPARLRPPTLPPPMKKLVWPPLMKKSRVLSPTLAQWPHLAAAARPPPPVLALNTPPTSAEAEKAQLSSRDQAVASAASDEGGAGPSRKPTIFVGLRCGPMAFLTDRPPVSQNHVNEAHVPYPWLPRPARARAPRPAISRGQCRGIGRYGPFGWPHERRATTGIHGLMSSTSTPQKHRSCKLDLSCLICF